MTGLESLEDRRVGLIKKFALKTAGNQKFAHWFAKNDEPVRNYRNKQSEWKQVYSRTNKFQKLAIPVMSLDSQCKVLPDENPGKKSRSLKEIENLKC